VNEKMERRNGDSCCPLWPAAHEGRERDFGEEEMKREDVGCQMKIFPIFNLIDFTSYNEIMLSAP